MSDERLDGRAAWAILAAITVVGTIPRLLHLDGSYVGDELSTLYLVADRSFSDVVSSVSSDAEISPPLYFVLSWMASQLSGAPELVRLPALLAGIASIPLTYLVGARMLNRPAGLVAAAAMALNPFMVFYATDARAYTVAIACLLGTTLAMLVAIDTRRTRWWVVYAALTCLCMYAHYTTAFVLGGQLLWLLWTQPEARRAALLANGAAALAFLPWLPSMLGDFDSPTIEILSDLQGDGFDIKWEAVKAWAFGYPYNLTGSVPGNVWVALALAALALGSVAAIWRWARAAPRLAGRWERWPRPQPGVMLALVLALATPVAELVLLGLGGSDLFGARNLNTASPGFALTIGAIVAGAGPLLGVVCGAAVLGVFALSTARSLEADVSTIDFKAAAEFVEREAGPDDVVLDMISAAVSPVPLTALDVQLEQGRPEYRPYLPEGSPPFIRFAPPPRPIVDEALEDARGSSLFIVTNPALLQEDAEGELSFTLPPAEPGRDETETVHLDGWRLVAREDWPGISGITVLELEHEGGAR